MTDSAERLPSAEAGENPLARSIDLTVSVPKTLRVEMVEASTLGDYEVWIFIASLLASAFTGVVVAAFQTKPHGPFAVVAGVFGALMLVALRMVRTKRSAIRRESTEVLFRAVRTGDETVDAVVQQ